FIASPLGLYVFFGGFTALAVSASGWTPALVHVQREYQDRVGLAMGIVSSGVGVGMLLVVPLTQVLIDAFGLPTSFRALGLRAGAWMVPASLWLMRASRRAPAPKAGTAGPRTVEIRTRDFTLREAMRTQPFWLLVGAFFFGNFASQTLHVHQVAHLVDHGLPAIIAATVVGVVGFSSIIGKTGGGWLSDRTERELVYVAGVAIMVVSALVLLALGAHPTALGAYGYAVLLGIGYSVTAALNPAMLSDRFSGRHFGSIVGVGLLGSALGSAAGPWLAGRLYDVTGSYTVPFLIAAGFGFIAMGAAWRARGLRVRAAMRAAEACP